MSVIPPESLIYRKPPALAFIFILPMKVILLAASIVAVIIGLSCGRQIDLDSIVLAIDCGSDDTYKSSDGVVY